MPVLSSSEDATVEDETGALLDSVDAVEGGEGVLIDSPDQVEDSGAPVTPAESPSTPLNLELTMDQPPVVGEAVEIVVDVMMALDDAPAVIAQLELPSGVDLVSGDTSWEGALHAGESIRFSATVVFIEPGEYGVSATALAPISAGMVYGDEDAIFLTIGEDASHFGLESGDNSQVESSTGP